MQTPSLFKKLWDRRASVAATIVVLIFLFSLYTQFNLNKQTHNLVLKNQTLALQAKEQAAQIDKDRIAAAINACDRGNDLRLSIRVLVRQLIQAEKNKNPERDANTMRIVNSNFAAVNCQSKIIIQGTRK